MEMQFGISCIQVSAHLLVLFSTIFTKFEGLRQGNVNITFAISSLQTKQFSP